MEARAMEIPDPHTDAAISELFDFLVGWKERHGIDDGIAECRLLACFLAGRLDVAAAMKNIRDFPDYEG